jgi:hypothetical protein
MWWRGGRRWGGVPVAVALVELRDAAIERAGLAVGARHHLHTAPQRPQCTHASETEEAGEQTEHHVTSSQNTSSQVKSGHTSDRTEGMDGVARGRACVGVWVGSDGMCGWGPMGREGGVPCQRNQVFLWSSGVILSQVKSNQVNGTRSSCAPRV